MQYATIMMNAQVRRIGMRDIFWQRRPSGDKNQRTKAWNKKGKVSRGNEGELDDLDCWALKEKKDKETKEYGAAKLGRDQKQDFKQVELGPTWGYLISTWTTAACGENAEFLLAGRQRVMSSAMVRAQLVMVGL